MALEELSLAHGPVDGGADGRQPSVEGGGGGAGDDVSKTPRLPRWTRQEILVLIQGKRVTESRVRTGRASGSAFGSAQIEPKWVSVSSYCMRHGVNRGPIQCRKRWSNLAGDFKKIKEWESKIKDETESFWLMRNDLRRERKLPGFFDKEVYDILDGGGGGGGNDEEVGGGLALALIPSSSAVAEEGGEERAMEALFDSVRSAADDGLFSDSEQPAQDDLVRSTHQRKEAPSKDIPDPIPISVAEKQYQSLPKESPARGTNHEKQPIPETEVGSTQEGRKRKRHSSTNGEDEETTNLEHTLLQALEKNGQMLRSQLEAQNTHLQLDREQRKDHADSLIAVLNKLADALGRVADKL